MDRNELNREVDQNYDFFQRNLSSYLEAQSGRFALVRHKKVVGFYDDPGDAAREGKKRFNDDIFSIQEVTDAPIDLGLYSYASN
jgi:hypothetical protein